MIPGLLLPGALAALVALFVPVVLHIARRSEQQPTDFAALRWLREKPRPRSQLRFDELLLLALRLALLVLLTLWLARPVLFGGVDNRAYVAVVPGADLSHAGVAAINDGKAHWLTQGFPAIDTAKPGWDVPRANLPVASLLRQLDSELPKGTPLTIVVPQVIEGADAEWPRLSRKVDWRIVPGAMPAARPVPVPVPQLSVRVDAAHAGAPRYLRAAAIAWQPPGARADIETSAIDAPLPDGKRHVVWLGGGTLPGALTQWIERGGSALVASDVLLPEGSTHTIIWRDDLGRPLVETMPIGVGQLMRFTRRLTPADMPELLEPDFPARLRALFDMPAPLPARVAAADYAPVTGGRGYHQQPLELRSWLAVLIAALLLAERWFATRRGRSVSP